MPLTMLSPGLEATIKSCRANGATKKFLEGLGIVPGATISVVNEINGDLIVIVKGSRLAINKGVAQQLHVSH